MIFGVVSDRRAATSCRWNENKSLCGRAKQRSVEKVHRNRLFREAIAL